MSQDEVSLDRYMRWLDRTVLGLPEVLSELSMESDDMLSSHILIELQQVVASAIQKIEDSRIPGLRELVDQLCEELFSHWRSRISSI